MALADHFFFAFSTPVISSILETTSDRFLLCLSSECTNSPIGIGMSAAPSVSFSTRFLNTRPSERSFSRSSIQRKLPLSLALVFCDFRWSTEKLLYSTAYHICKLYSQFNCFTFILVSTSSLFSQLTNELISSLTIVSYIILNFKLLGELQLIDLPAF